MLSRTLRAFPEGLTKNDLWVASKTILELLTFLWMLGLSMIKIKKRGEKFFNGYI